MIDNVELVKKKMQEQIDGLKKELEEARAEVADWRETQRAVMSEKCPSDEKHCTCVPMLRAKLEGLPSVYANVAELQAAWEELDDERKAKLEAAEKELEDEDRQICDQRNKAEALLTEREKSLSRVQSENNIRKEKIEKLEAENAALREDKVAMANHGEDLRQELEQAQADLLASEVSRGLMREALENEIQKSTKCAEHKWNQIGCLACENEVRKKIPNEPRSSVYEALKGARDRFSHYRGCANWTDGDEKALTLLDSILGERGQE